MSVYSGRFLSFTLQSVSTSSSLLHVINRIFESANINIQESLKRLKEKSI